MARTPPFYHSYPKILSLTIKLSQKMLKTMFLNNFFLKHPSISNISLLLFLVNILGEPLLPSFGLNSHLKNIAKKCFDIWGILKMASVKSVEPGNHCFSVNNIIRCTSRSFSVGIFKICPGSGLILPKFG